jgi:electron transfer flavoprotein beta subunit
MRAFASTRREVDRPRDVEFTMNESDAYALEEALQLKEAHGGEVVVSQRRPRARRQDHPRSPRQGRRPRHSHRQRSRKRTGAIRRARRSPTAGRGRKRRAADLILTGLQSDDLGLGQTGVILAELLGLPHATLILKIEKTETGLKVLRELEDGWFQHLELPTPAVLTIQSGNSKLRYATLMGIKKAKTKEVRTVSVAELGVAAEARQSSCWSTSSCPSKQRTTQILGGTPAEAAAALVEKLQFEVRAL